MKDPIGEFLREHQSTFQEPHPHSVKPERPYSIPKFVALAMVPIVLVCTILLVNSLHTPPSPPAATTVESTEAPYLIQDEATPPPFEVGRVVLVTAGVKLTRTRKQASPEGGQSLIEGDVLLTGPNAYAGLELGSHALVVGPDSSLTLNRVTVELHHGKLATRAEGPIEIRAGNASITTSDALFSIEAYSDDIQRVAVEDGEVTVRRTLDDQPFTIPRARAIDTVAWTTSPALPDRQLISKLEEVVALTSPPPPPPDASTASSTTPPSKSLASRIRTAIKDGDVAAAIQLVETQGEGHTDAEYLLAAADAYKQASQWSEAADQYLKASDDAQGKEAERALLRAAQIHLKKLGDPTRAAEIIDEYFTRYPTGTYLDEALYLAAIIQVRLGNHTSARTYYEKYIDLYPNGVQAVRAHIALAKLLAFTLDDCPAAMTHVHSLAGKAKGPAIKDQLAKVLSKCTTTEQAIP